LATFVSEDATDSRLSSSGDLKNLPLVQRLTRQQGAGKRVELFPVGAQQPFGLLVALADDPEDLRVDRFRRRFAEGFFAGIAIRAGASCTAKRSGAGAVGTRG
jgi:hypothetical protein